MEEIETVRKLLAYYRLLPGIGSKTAERLAYATLELSDGERQAMIDALSEVNTDLKRCPDCGLFYLDNCPICSDPRRDHQQILLVSSTKDIYAIERTQEFHGTYFTLNGTLSPLRNRTPDVIGIPKLKERVRRDSVHEIILALPTDLEGETTALYVANIYKDNPDVSVSRLAYGLPIGTNLEYLDNMTISQSLKGRVRLNKE